MSPSNAKVFSKRNSKLIFSIFMVVILMSGYVTTVKGQASKDVAREIYDTSFAIAHNWKLFADSISLPIEHVESAELSSLCLSECTALDMMIMSDKLILPEYLKTPILNVSKGVFVSNSRGYTIAGYKVSSIYVNASNTKIGLLFEDVDVSLLSYIENKYDDDVFIDENGLSGQIRYSTPVDKRASLGIFFNINGLSIQ